MLEADAGGVLPGDEQLEGVLRGLPLVQEEPPELLFLDAGEGVVDDRQHEVHQEVEVDGEVPGRGPIVNRFAPIQACAKEKLYPFLKFSALVAACQTDQSVLSLSAKKWNV